MISQVQQFKGRYKRIILIARRRGYNVRCNRLLGNESILLSRGSSTNQRSCRESAHCALVPFYARAEGVVYDRHTFLNS